MNIETSSAVRKYLPKILKAVFENNEDLEIELNGQVVAILTLQEPHRAIAPLRVKLKMLRKDGQSYYKRYLHERRGLHFIENLVSISIKFI